MIKKRLCYLAAFLAILAAEFYIGAYVSDAFVRPYGGDILVAALLCCLWRCIFPEGSRRMPVWVFLFCCAVEFSQLLNLPKRFGFEGTVLAIAIGSSFAWLDIWCYAIGCAVFWLAERLVLKCTKV